MVTRNSSVIHESTYKTYVTFYIRVDDTIAKIADFLTALTQCESARRITLFDATKDCKMNAEAVKIILDSKKLRKLNSFEVLSDHCEYGDFPTEFGGKANIGQIIPQSSIEPFNRLLVLSQRERNLRIEQETKEIEAVIQSAFAPQPKIAVDPAVRRVRMETLLKYSFVEHRNDSADLIHLSNGNR